MSFSHLSAYQWHRHLLSVFGFLLSNQPETYRQRNEQGYLECGMSVSKPLSGHQVSMVPWCPCPDQYNALRISKILFNDVLSPCASGWHNLHSLVGLWRGGPGHHAMFGIDLLVDLWRSWQLCAVAQVHSDLHSTAAAVVTLGERYGEVVQIEAD